MKPSFASLLFITMAAVFVVTSANHATQVALYAQAMEPSLTFNSPVQIPHANAAQKKDGIVPWGVEAYITWTDPNLRGGTGSGHRVIVVLENPTRPYTELGWAKLNDGLHSYVTYFDGIMPNPVTQFFENITPITHQYTIQYDPTQSKHFYFIDGIPFFSQAVNFSSGNRVVAGGEVIDGFESMGNTLLYDLRYLTLQGSNFLFVPWDGYERYVEDRPYCNILNGPNSFYDTECWIFLPTLLKTG